MDTERFVQFKDRLLANCRSVIVGKDEVIEQIVICLIAGGHVLLEDVPGKEPGREVLPRTVHPGPAPLGSDRDQFLQSEGR